MSIPVRHTARSLAVALAWMLLSLSPAYGQNNEGMFVTVQNPITTEGVNRIKTFVNQRIGAGAGNPERATTVIFDFNPDGKPAATPDFGACLSLQDYILNTVNGSCLTVAYVHANTSGHTVLPVLACRELVMSSSAAVGQITDDGNPPLVPALNASKETIYRETLQAVGRIGQAAVVKKMYDANVKLRKGFPKADPQNAVFFDANNPAEAAKIANADDLKPIEGVQDGQIGFYANRYAKDLGLCKATADNREAVAQLYGLSPSSLRDDPLEGRTPDVYRWSLKKDIDGSIRESLSRVIRDVKQKGGNVLILTLNVGGNDLVTARNIADDLRAAQTGDDKIKIIAFIPELAPSAGTVVALGCSEIYMTKPKPDAMGDAKEAEIGDFSGYLKSARQADIDANLSSIRDLAKNQGYPELLIDGMFKPEIEILRVKPIANNIANQRRFMTREQFNLNKDEWVEDKVVKSKDQLLKLNTTQAVEYGIARASVEGNTDKSITTMLGWPDAKSSDPGWLDKFADFLRNPVVAVLLVVIGFTGLILELKVPGLTVPGIIAAMCFLLVFWAHSKFSGQTFALALLLFLLGLVLVGIEIFVLPGFGACGIFGIMCMLGGLGLVTLDKVPQTGGEWGKLGEKVSLYMFAMMGAFVLAFTVARYLPKVPGGNRLVLNTPSELGVPSDNLPGAADAAELLGAIGTTNTPLRPAGMVKFGDKFVDVVSDGGFIPAGTRVQVIQVEGTRIVVKEV